MGLSGRMADLDFTALTPHEPVTDVGRLYVQRPQDGAARLAALVERGAGAIAVVGPVGCGKSTEIRRATGKQPVLLVDGLEKCHANEAQKVVEVLLRFRAHLGRGFRF